MAAVELLKKRTAYPCCFMPPNLCLSFLVSCTRWIIVLIEQFSNFFDDMAKTAEKRLIKFTDRLTDLGVYGDLFLTTSFAGSYLKLSLRHGCICVVVYGCVCNFCVCMCNCAVFDFFICHAYPAAFYVKNKLNMDRKASPEDERV